GKLADLGAEGAGEEPTKSRGAEGRQRGVVERLSEQLAGPAEVLPLQKRCGGELVGVPERIVSGFARAGEPRVGGHRGKPALAPRDGRSDRCDPVARVVTFRACEPGLRGVEGERQSEEHTSELQSRV